MFDAMAELECRLVVGLRLLGRAKQDIIGRKCGALIDMFQRSSARKMVMTVGACTLGKF